MVMGGKVTARSIYHREKTRYRIYGVLWAPGEVWACV